MVIRSLKLVQFRNYEDESFNFHPEINAIVGLNGMGKTNVLEAIYYLCIGKSYFSPSDKFVVRKNGDFFRINGTFDDGAEIKDVVIKCQAGIKKDIEVAGVKSEKISDHIGQFLCVIVAPNDIQQMLEGSEERRNFLNNTIVQSDRKYLDALMQYTQLLKHRNALLKNFLDTHTFNAVLLESVTSGIFKPATYIYEKRKEQIEKIVPVFNKMYYEISGGCENCDITYHSQLENDTLESLLRSNLERDRILGRTTQGIHKDDLIFSMDQQPLKNFASQGQLKSYVLALKLTQYKMIENSTGKKPLILLDDIFDKLDQDRVRQLLELLTTHGFGQIFITDTMESRIHNTLQQIDREHVILKISGGKHI